MLPKLSAVFCAVAMHAGVAGVMVLLDVGEAEPKSKRRSPESVVTIALRRGSPPVPPLRPSDVPVLETSPREVARDRAAARPAPCEASPDFKAPREPEAVVQAPAQASAGDPADAVSPVAVHTPAPRYPRPALRAGQEGSVLVEFQIRTDGSCTEIRVVESSGFRILDEAATGAISQWRFQPIRVPIQRIRFTFRLSDQER